MFERIFGKHNENETNQAEINVPFGDLMKSVNARNGKGQTALHIAVEKDNLKMTRYLASQQNSNTNVANNEGNMPLHIASRRDGKDTVKYLDILFQNGANVNAKNAVGETPLHLAVQAGNQSSVDFLLSKFASVFTLTHKDGVKSKSRFFSDIPGSSSPLHYAFYSNKLSADIVGMLLLYDPNVNQVNQDELTPFQLALKHHDINALSPEIVKNLINPSDLRLKTQRNQTCLHIMAENIHLDNNIFNHVITSNKFKNIEVNAVDDKNQTALFCLIENKHTEKALILLRRFNVNPNIGNDKTYPLHLAVKNNLTELCLALIRNKADVNLVDGYGYTPLMYAAEAGNSIVIDALKNTNADFTCKMTEFAVKKALLRNHIDIVIQLINYGANPDVHIYPGYQYMQFSSIMRCTDDGVDKTGYLKAGDTLLHFAIKTENKPLALTCLKANQ